jgi:dTDP-4-dehydrorhamnose reductase
MTFKTNSSYLGAANAASSRFGLRVIVLGSKGQLGSEVASLLEANGVDVVRVTRDQLDASSGNLAEQLANLPASDFYLNCYAFVNVDAAEKSCADAFQVNAIFPYALAKHCREVGSKLIHISTDFVFSGDIGRPYLEDDEVSPINIYGLSKAAGESAVRGSCPDHFILRVSGLYGRAGSESKGGNFVETMIKIGTANGLLNVVNDQFTTPTHTIDVARAVLALIRSREAAAGTYHCANKGVCSWFEFAREIIRLSGVEAEVRPALLADFRMKAPRPVFSALHTEKINSIYAMPTWREGLTEYLALRS